MKHALVGLIGSSEGGGMVMEVVLMAAEQMINHWSGSVGTVTLLCCSVRYLQHRSMLFNTLKQSWRWYS